MWRTGAVDVEERWSQERSMATDPATRMGTDIGVCADVADLCTVGTMNDESDGDCLIFL